MADQARRRKCLARFSVPMLGDGKGKALILEEAVALGDGIVLDWPDAAVPAIEEDGVPTCAQCLRSLESSHQNLERVLGLDRQRVAATLGPLPDGGGLQPVCCEAAGEGCPEVYCSEGCRRGAWEDHHCVLCPLREQRDPGRPLLVAYQRETWEVNGVDFADIFWMALRVVATALAGVHRGGLALAEALRPFGAYVSADWAEISGDNPVNAYEEEAEDEEPGPPPQPRHRSTLLTVLEDLPHLPARDGEELAPCAKARLVAHAITYKHCFAALPPDAVEALFHPHFWAHLLGMVLLNSQTVYPKSPLAVFCTAQTQSPAAGPPPDLQALLGAALPVSKRYLLPVLQRSTQGIALYPLHSCINHSCAPNAEVVFEGPDAEVLVRASRPIAAGEEVCISYINVDGDRALRQWLLQHSYLFRCRCARCTS